MGKGYWILLWDEFGDGLNLINPRLHTEGDRNWWPWPSNVAEDDDLVLERHFIPPNQNARVIW